MYRKTALWLLLAMLITGLAASMNQKPSPAYAQDAPQSDPWALRVLEADERHVLLELSMSSFESERVVHEGTEYQRLRVADWPSWGQPGQPQLPMYSIPLGMPRLDTPRISVLEVASETLTGYVLYPTPAMERSGTEEAPQMVEKFILDSNVYSTDAYYPGPVAEAVPIGLLRDQPLFQLRLYPLQYNPLRQELRFYRRLKVLIAFPESIASLEETGRAQPVPVFERILERTLLNYDALPRPATAEAPHTGFALNQVRAATAATNTLKIGVAEDGLYQLTYDDLANAGFSLASTDARTLRITNRGAEIPIYVQGESDGTLDPGDTILFYGTAITDVYTTRNVYWLTAGDTAGQRMGTRDGTPGTATVPAHFPATLHAEKDTYYWQAMPNGAGQDYWFWGERLTATASRAYSATLNHVSTTASTATVRVRLKGYTAVSASPDHHTRIYLNGTIIDDQRWDGQTIYDHEVEVSHGLLHEGTNTVTVEAIRETGVSVDQILFNWIEIDYWDTYVAENDALLFGAPAAGTYRFEVTGFSSSDVQALDVTDPSNVALITGTAVLADGSGYRLQFEDTAQAETRYLALTSARRKSPATVKLDQPSSWKDPSQGADHVIITHENFYTSALTLANHRNTVSGLRVATVKIEDVYDEFNDGIFSPQAIRDFLTYAYHNWVAPAPSYVLLIGDGYYDYKDNLNTGVVNYVPSQIIETDLWGQAFSDNWFALVSGADILPDMFMGRLTASTVSEANNMVNKIIYYDQHPPAASWNKQVLLVADDGSSNDGYTYAFENTSEQLAGQLPFNYTAHKIYVRYYPPGNPTTDITNHINSGMVLVNYAGHGSSTTWGGWSGGTIFSRSNITALSNTNRLPMVTAADCYNGYFVGTAVSMAEEFLRLSDRGAVAVWASTSLGYPSGHQLLMGEFYDAIFQDDQYALGAATTAAKIATYGQNSFWGELVETFVLFGDPATLLGIPSNYPYVESTTPAYGATNVPLGQDIQVAFSRPMSTTTVLLDGPGAPGFTPSWNSDHTAVTYTHPDFTYSTTYTLTVTGKDNLGNPLGTGPVPGTWSFRTPTAPSDVNVSGPLTGVVQVSYAFNAAVSPATATQPITYVWQATGQTPVTRAGRGLNDTITFNWNTPGTKTITTTATNIAGTATGTHQVTLTYSPPARVEITGPTKAAIDTPYAFTAAVSPITATQSITYAWQATGQVPVTRTGAGLSDVVTFTWDTTGTQVITVTATNAGGSATSTHQLAILSTSVDIAGPTTGFAQTDYTFAATVNPVTAVQPITYIWQATGQAPLTHTDRGLDDTATYNWTSPGTKTIAVTATNAMGVFTNTWGVTIQWVPPASVDVTGPLTVTAGIASPFTAAVSPITTTQPITYAWQVTGQAPVTHTSAGLSDVVTFTWGSTGTQVITVTATNAGGSTTNAHHLIVGETAPTSGTYVYLPLVIKDD